MFTSFGIAPQLTKEYLNLLGTAWFSIGRIRLGLNFNFKTFKTMMCAMRIREGKNNGFSGLLVFAFTFRR